MKNKRVIPFIVGLLLILCMIICCSANSFARKKDLPEAPMGYVWKWCKSIQAGFLLPNGWFFKEVGDEETKAFFITKEPIDKENLYNTGFSANVIKNSLKKTSMIPSEYAKKFIDRMKSLTQASGVGLISVGNYFKGKGGFFRSKPKGLGIIVQYMLVLGNDTTGTLYIFSFESPEVNWDNEWKSGSIIMNNLALESEF